jgi:hypothetical protein
MIEVMNYILRYDQELELVQGNRTENRQSTTFFNEQNHNRERK